LICIHFSTGQDEYNLQKRNSGLQPSRQGVTGHFPEGGREDKEKPLCSKKRKLNFRIELLVADSKTIPLAKIRPDLLGYVPSERI
jgi:hypothetical protein